MNFRKLLLLVGILIGLQSFTLSNPESDRITFHEKGLAKLIKQAKKENKLVFILVESRYCEACRHLDKDLRKGGEFSKFFNDNFLCYRIYADNSLKQLQAGNWGVTRVPSLVFMDGNRKIVHFAEGYRSMETVTSHAQKAVDYISTKNLTKK